MTEKPSSSFKISPITPIQTPRNPREVSLDAATEKFRVRNARMRRGLRIGFRKLELGDDELQPIDFDHKKPENS